MITLISGTNRADSNTRKVTAEIEAIYRDLKVPTQTLDLVDLPADLFTPAAYSIKPVGFTKFSDAILNSDGLVVITPEYNGGMPGVLKYFIDMLKFPEAFEHRPVCFVGVAAGMFGALRPVEHLQQIFGYRNAHIYPARVFVPGVMNQLDATGKLKDPELRERFKQQAEGFTTFVEKLKGKSLRP
ncbi:MAG TPA: NADPH-dependent FMN reductase [Verrucomicrobiae bacterium]